MATDDNDSIVYGALARAHALGAGVTRWWEVDAWDADEDREVN